ncbi:MAG TPA: histidinol-phosphate transaminase [Buchnera sp. (in: enterobacteria)]|nr:histidinol-phosphate transaminase [Buchnera sp. (in: enterobacteria)]
MKLSIKNLIRDNIKTLVPYQSARRIGGKGNIWLNANESPIANNFFLKKNIFNRYPESQPQDLILRYSKYVNILSKKILVTRGSDEAIELLMKTFCNPGHDAIMFCPPTYDMYYVNANILGINSIQIPMLKNWQLDIVNIKKHSDKVKLIYICSPNNPTGNVIDAVDINQLLQFFYGRALVIIDEAYIEFCIEKNLIAWLDKYEHLVILRTLSKAFALAGLRCGFVLAHQNIINILSTVIAPYPLPTPVADIAHQALTEKNIFLMQSRVSQLNKNRKWLIKELKKINFIETIFHTDSNYILVRFFNVEKIFYKFWNMGVILRNQNSKKYLDGCIRISVGTFKECFKVVEILKNVK